MRSTLFLLKDEHLVKRIRITVHDESSENYYAGNIDEAIRIMEEHEIAVAVIPYGYDILNGNELIEMLLDHNAGLRVILIFEEDQLLAVVRTHNLFHLSKLICTNHLNIEDLPRLIEESYRIYNKESELKQIETDFRRRENKYKNTMNEISMLLNERMESYKEIRTSYRHFLLFLLTRRDDREQMSACIDAVLEQFIDVFLLREKELAETCDDILLKYNDPANERSLSLQLEDDASMDPENVQKMIFSLQTILQFLYEMYDKYRGSIELTSGKFDSLNLLLEGIRKQETASVADETNDLILEILQRISDRCAYGAKDQIFQYKLIFEKGKT